MRLFRLLVIFVLTLGVVAIGPVSAWAGGATTTARSVAPAVTPPPTNLSAPIIADFNGDGLPDQAILGQIGTTTMCAVSVQNGLAGGGFGPAKVHKYTSAEQNGPFCPDRGAAIKLGQDKRPDLVTGFNFGFEDIVALHNFKPSAVFRGVEQPDIMVAVDLHGNGRDDLLESTNEGGELATFTNTDAGTLVRGNSVCEEDGLGPRYTLADLNGRGGKDILLSEVCPRDEASQSAVVLFGTGGQHTFVSTCDETVRYTLFVIDLDSDGKLDVGLITTKPNTPTTIRYFHNNGGGNFTQVTGPGSGPVIPIVPPTMSNPCSGS